MSPFDSEPVESTNHITPFQYRILGIKAWRKYIPHSYSSEYKQNSYWTKQYWIMKYITESAV